MSGWGKGEQGVGGWDGISMYKGKGPDARTQTRAWLTAQQHIEILSHLNMRQRIYGSYIHTYIYVYVYIYIYMYMYMYIYIYIYIVFLVHNMRVYE